MISIEDFRLMLSLEDKYAEFRAINQLVLKPAIKELNEKSDIIISVDTVKKWSFRSRFTLPIQTRQTDKNSNLMAQEVALLKQEVALLRELLAEKDKRNEDLKHAMLLIESKLPATPEPVAQPAVKKSWQFWKK